MAPYLSSLIPRAPSPDDNDSNAITPVVIAGIAVASVAFLAVVIWLGIRAYRQRSKKHRADKRNSAFLNVKGLVSEKSSPLAISRSNLDGVVMPTSSLSKADILSHHEKSGTLTRAFARLPPPGIASPAPVAVGTELAVPQPARSSLNPSRTRSPPHRGRRASSGPRPLSSLNPAFSRSSLKPALAVDTHPPSRPLSTISWLVPTPPSPSSQRASRFSFRTHSRGSSIYSSGSSGVSTAMGERKVHQVFEPVLPDELVVRVGERVSVVQTLDDGWCVIGRGALGTGDVEMGVIPAWCFVKPVKGLRAERPMRTTSLGITVQIEPPSGEREQIISWSNF